MHSRRLTWYGIIIGVLLFQACKLFVGMAPNWETVYDAMFWSGSALILDWYQQGDLVK